jgi:glycosyltransferase involved in cell wall biosynthesis
MPCAPQICVLVPVYNHGLTVQHVVREARAHLPVIAVNDGSTDGTAAALANEDGITVVNHARNLGKASALLSGFERARALGFTHAITIDADGQHPTDAIAAFVEVCRREPEAFVIGVRDLKREGAPRRRRLANALSTFWFKLEAGLALTDTQCGFRCYPLEAIHRLRIRAVRYAFEFEIMVKAAWAGIPLVALPVGTDYRAPTSRLSHFRPFQDMLQMSAAHSRLCLQALCVPARLRRLAARGELRAMPRGRRMRTIVHHLLTAHP